MTNPTPFDPTKPCCLRAEQHDPEPRIAEVHRVGDMLAFFIPARGRTSMRYEWRPLNGRMNGQKDSLDDLVNIPPAPAPRCEPPEELEDKLALTSEHWLERDGMLGPIRALWVGGYWSFSHVGQMSPEEAYQHGWRYHSPCVPGPRYGEADPRDKEIERLMATMWELEAELAAKDAEIKSLKDDRLLLSGMLTQSRQEVDRLKAEAPPRQPIEVTDKMVKAFAIVQANRALDDLNSFERTRRAIEAALAARER